MLFNGEQEPEKIWVKYHKDFTKSNSPYTLDELINIIQDIDNTEKQWNIYYRKNNEYHYDHTFDPGRKFEPVGQYILLGQGRDGLPQYQINGTGNTTFIGSVFTFGFLIEPEKGGCITYQSIEWSEFDKYITKMNKCDIWRPEHELYVNFTGHEQTAQLINIPMQRITIRARPGDKVVWAQYKGPRLEEGSITVPEEAEFTPMRADIYDANMMKIVNEISKSYLKGVTKYKENNLCE